VKHSTNLHSASRGPSAIAELLVIFNSSAEQRQISYTIGYRIIDMTVHVTSKSLKMTAMDVIVNNDVVMYATG